ncbi:Ribonuclease BN, tRNA processing enzyme [Pelagirhabdus alkalitolerans]|uniref:Ribonuclease BN, tRNA processing enzyme n=1 Tax=Pelagirhabdus alkalitolerans TaxID=1612202 RepID=A0A1G6LMD5_9BACI|nr:MBL fold metallo-hydrolase [Pelagirhabdus alkalitolerans]SDC44410.1 Ribonuclease BN, tRNA processing enzyme [Pelagirhabdus alkalitolerans]
MKLTTVGFWGGYPEQGEATSSFLIEKDGFKLLVDAGSGALSQLPKYTDPYSLDAVILSHYHHDHIADVGVLQYHMLVQNGVRQAERVLPIYGHNHDKASFDSLTHQFTTGVAYNPETTLNLGPFEIQFMPTEHPVTCFAMRITDGEDTIVYTADSSYLDGFIEFSEGADLLITDCNFYDGQDGSAKGHMNAKECAHIANHANVDTLVLSHHPHFGDRSQLVPEARRYFNGQVVLAHSGYTWRSS